MVNSSPKVRTLHKKFPDAKFINLVRSPLRVIPSSISMFSNHWKTYGDPEEDYPQPAPAVMQEQAKHWYVYPHQYLKTLPADQYVMVRYQDLVADPQMIIEHIYQRFGIEMTEEYHKTLVSESEKAKQFKSKHAYSLKRMGLNGDDLEQEFDEALKEYAIEPKIKRGA